jgi:prepilin-type N-terminal cleavage/methylation domain-containing protein
MMTMIRSKRQAGFTLIELGIVIAVIAILAAVVIVGRGFINSAKVSKAVDQVDVMRKAVSTIGGARGGDFTSITMGELTTRSYVAAARSDGTWSSPIEGFRVSFLTDTVSSPARYAVTAQCPDSYLCKDICTGAMKDTNIVTGQTCAANSIMTWSYNLY